MRALRPKPANVDLWHATLSFSLVLALLGFAPGVLGQQTVNLEGQVRTESGAVLRTGVTVRLETNEGLVAGETPVDTEGHYQFQGLKKMPYVLLVMADGYETTQQTVDASLGAAMIIKNVILTPAHRTKEDVRALPTRSDASASKLARKEYKKGSQALTQGDYDGARSHLEKAVTSYPCYARAQTDLATVLGLQHDARGAEAALRKAQECDPDFLDSYIELGQVLNREKRYAESVSVLQDGLRRSPNSWQFYYQLGIAHAGLGQLPQAEEEYAKVLSLNPAPPAEIHVKLADIYLKQDHYDKASAEMDAYLKAEPTGRFAGKIRDIQQQMRSTGVLRSSRTSPQ